MKQWIVSVFLMFAAFAAAYSQTKDVFFATTPAVSPDGKTVVFSYEGDLWKVGIDGGGAVRLTAMQGRETFPRISPDGKWIVFISFPKDIAPGDHPFYKHVYLRLIPINANVESKPKVIAYLYGGQGTINVPSWSPDSKKIAFVSNSELK